MSQTNENWLLRQVPGLQGVWPHLPAVGIGCVLACCLVLVILGRIHDPLLAQYKTLDWSSWLWVEAGHVASVGLVAGVAAIVIRILSISGYFRHALSGIVDTELVRFEPRVRELVENAVYTDQAIERRRDIVPLWQTITAKVLLPGFIPKNEGDWQFLNSVNGSLRAMIRELVNYYVDDFRRVVTIVEFDRTQGTFLVRDEAVFDVVPYNLEKPVEYKLRYDANAGMTIASYQIRDIMFKVDGDDKLATIESGTTTDASVRIIPITLTGKPRYKIQRISEHRQVLDNDPVILIAPDYVCTGMQLQIRCRPPGLSVRFAEIGIDGAFRPELDHLGRDPNELDYRCDQTLLPEQGFIIVVTRTPNFEGSKS